MQRTRPFNVTLIQPPGFLHALALKEAADYLHATISACGYRSVRTANTIANDAHNVVVCAHLLPPEHARRIPSGSIIFNSEPLEDDAERHHYSSAYPEILDRHVVWDYSHRNLALIPHDRKAVIPFLNCPALKLSALPRRHGTSLLFYGRLTPRRRVIIDALQAGGIPVQVLFGQYETVRDVQMLQAWAVLNLHKNDDTATFEPIRCFYPLLNGVPVISESARDPAADDFADSIFFSESAALVNQIQALYRDPVAFRASSQEKLGNFLQTDPLPTVARALAGFFSAQEPRCQD